MLRYHKCRFNILGISSNYVRHTKKFYLKFETKTIPCRLTPPMKLQSLCLYKPFATEAKKNTKQTIPSENNQVHLPSSVIDLEVEKTPTPSNELFFKYPSLVMKRMLPFYVDNGGLLSRLADWVKDPLSTTDILVILDNPGLGKSTAPFAAACKENTGYILLETASDILQSITSSIELHLQTKFPAGGTEQEVINEMTDMFVYGLAHLFTRATHEMTAKKSARLFASPLNNFHAQSFEAHRPNLTAKAIEALKALLDEVKKLHKDKLIVHFDEMQLWATQQFHRNPTQLITKNYQKYYLLALSHSFMVFKGWPVRFAITGTNMELGKILQLSSPVKITPLRLPYFSADSVMQLLDLFCNTQHLERTALMKKIAAPLSGSVRSSEYFLQEVKADLANLQPEQVDLPKLEACLKNAQVRWGTEIGTRYDSIPGNFLDELLLVLMFPHCFGGKPDTSFSDVWEFPVASIPNHWLPFTEIGIVRAEFGGDICRIWKPYHFLLSFMKSRLTLFVYQDVKQLESELSCGNIAPDKRKGYCFQRAVALELVNPHISNFWKLMSTKIHALCGISLTPCPLSTKQIKLFDRDEQVKVDQVCMAQDVKRNTKKFGDIAGMRFQDTNNKYWKIFMELKYAKGDYCVKGLSKFFGEAKTRPGQMEIYVFVSYQPLSKTTIKSSYDEVKQKIYLVIDGIQPEDFFVDVASLSNPSSSITLAEMLTKLSGGFPELVRLLEQPHREA